LPDKIDTVFFIGQITRRVANSQDSYDQNLKIAQWIINHVPKHVNIIFTSSIDVFGADLQLIKPQNVHLPFDFYSQSKSDSEHILSKYFNISTLYLPGLFGHSINEKSIVSAMLSTLVRQGGIFLTNPNIVRATISYYECSKILEGIANYAQFHKTDPKVSRFLPTTNSYSLNQIANIVIKAFCNLKKQRPENISIGQYSEDTSQGRANIQILAGNTDKFISYEHQPLETAIMRFISKCLA